MTDGWQLCTSEYKWVHLNLPFNKEFTVWVTNQSWRNPVINKTEAGLQTLKKNLQQQIHLPIKYQKAHETDFTRA